ncbi:MAG: flagellar biosynthetic protein FliO [Leptospirales bacterium]|nr:flagellar biosynthetic protein FliO [Leptospirales bacterium]
MRHNTKMQNSQMKGNMKFIILSIFSLILILSCLSVNPALAQDAPAPVNNNGTENNVPGQNFVEDDFKPQIEEESASWLIIKTLFVLGLFIGGFYFFYKFVAQKTGLNLSGQEAIRILSTVSLGTNKFIQIIDVAGKIFLLGVTDNNINLLTEIKDKEEIDRIRLLSSRSTPVQGAKFQDFLTERIGWVVDKVSDIRSRGNKKQRKHTEYDIEDLSSKDFDMSYINKQKDRLKKMNGDDE